MSKLPTALPPVLKSLCAKLALERVRAQQWRLAADYRRQVQARLDAGQDAAELQADLERELGAALAAQASR